MPYERHHHRKSSSSREHEVVRVSAIERFWNDHIRLIVVIATILVIIFVFYLLELLARGDIGFFQEDSFEGTTMPMTYVRGLAEKPEALTWMDFKDFSYVTYSDTDADGGFRVRVYETEGGEWEIMVGGKKKDGAVVSYATLYRVGNTDISFDLMGYDDIDRFLEKHGNAD